MLITSQNEISKPKLVLVMTLAKTLVWGPDLFSGGGGGGGGGVGGEGRKSLDTFAAFPRALNLEYPLVRDNGGLK